MQKKAGVPIEKCNGLREKLAGKIEGHLLASVGLPAHPLRRSVYRASTSGLAGLSSLLLSIYQATLEFRVEGDDHLRILEARSRNYVAAVWHTFVDAAIFCLHSRGLVVYSDHPRTEEYEKSWTHFLREIGLKTIRSLGFEVLDASLGKQSAGIVNFIKMIKSGSPALVAPDGPHGPIYKAKPGVIYMARKSDSVVLPVGFSFSRYVTGPNWDDFSLPLPFSRVAMVIGEPIDPFLFAEDELDKAALMMEERLDQLHFRANELIGKENAAP